MVAVLLLAVVAGCQQAVVAQPGTDSTSPAFVEKVTAAKPARKALQLFSVQPARLEAIEQAPLHSKLSGYVKEVRVDLGDVVRQGDVLLVLAVPEMDVELLQKKALVDQAAAETRQAESAQIAAEAKVVTARSQIAQAEASIARTAADVSRWESEFSRLQQLADSGSLNRQLADETKQKLAAAQAAGQETKAAVESAKALLSETEAGVAKAAADIAAAQAHERVAAANHQYAQAMLSYASIKSPFAGTIVRRQVDPGHLVAPAANGAPPLVVVARTDTIRVFVAIPELEAALVDVGDPVTIQVQSLRGEEIAGSVSRTAWAIDDSNRALETAIDLENTTGKLRPGMYATAKVLLAERPDALVLPSAAVVRKEGKAFCFIVRDGQVVQTAVELGIKVGDEWEIASGLTGNEMVCLTKAATLQDGQAVETAPPIAKK
ncbi:MAG: efflux RND transporter periplasmic adaptor subunit [Pirellulaceae bacterium]